MFKRLQGLLLVAFILVGASGLVRIQMDRQTPSAPPLLTVTPDLQETATIDQGEIQITVSASGALQPNQMVALAFSATGKVATIPVEQGDHVLKGQIIATLDNQLALDAVLLAQGQVDLAQLAVRGLTDRPRQVDIDVAKASLNLAQARLYEATHSVDRTNADIANANVSLAKNSLYLQQLTRDADQQQKQKLLKDPHTAGLANQLPTDAMENAALDAKQFNVLIAEASAGAAQSQSGNAGTITAAQAQVTVAQNALDSLLEGSNSKDIARAQAGLKAAQSALDLAKANLSKSTLVAPFDGVIAKLYLNPGQQVPPGPAIILVDTTSFYVDLPIDEVNISQVTLDQKVVLKMDALPGQAFTGKVTRIAKTGTKIGSVVTYMVRAVVDPSDQPLLGSMTTTATIVTGDMSSVVRIPRRFVRVDPVTGKRYATVQQGNGSYQDIEIMLGLQNSALSEVISGLKAGDVVVRPQSNPPGAIG